MAFRLEDFKKTTRKSESGPAAVYPHQMKDKKSLARLEVAVRTFDGLVGRKRGEMEAQTLTDFFGDPRLARGVVACLGRFYRYRTPSFPEAVGAEAAERLTNASLATPRAVRARTYAHANAEYGGFLTEADRPAAYESLAAPFGLTARDWDALMHLDAEANQILTRLGAVPCPADLAALYNFHSLETPLRRASQVVLHGLSLTASEAGDVRHLARRLGVRAVVSGGGDAITLTDRDASPLLPARPGRLSRAALSVLQAWGHQAMTGHIDALLGTKKFRLTLSADALKALGVPKAVRPKPGLTFRRRLELLDALHKDLLKRRAQGGAAGWRFQRSPDPLVSPLGVCLPDLRLTRGDQSVAVVVGDAPSGDWDIPVFALPAGRRAPSAEALLAQAEAQISNLFTTAPPAQSVPADVRALFDRAATQGVVPLADAQRVLHLLDESPLIAWVKQAEDPRIRYVPGVGLCSSALIDALAGAA